ncbi:MAG: NAD(P)H-hydrate dehydratase [Acidobacteriia bacterium]|nr:NAD(P)H-hydrate dehydratase [Terriglobia bacterium]
MEILTGEQMRRVDRRAIESLGIPGLLLMESAGRGIAEALLADFPDARARGIVVLCGKGNNGGDGLVAARFLARAGLVPKVILLAAGDELSGDAATNLRAARASGLTVLEAVGLEDWERQKGVLRERGPVVLDALLGTGVRGGARGLPARVIDDLNRSGATVVSVDLPSGLDSDSCRVEGPAVSAARTYTLCRPKIALVLEPASAFSGAWKVLPIGIPDVAVAEENPDLEWLDAAALSGALPVRRANAHKGTYGHLLAVAGSRGKAGAAALVARAALRTGVGLVTVATPASALPVVAAQQAEVMTEPLDETASGAISAAASARVLDLLLSRTALALGPGLGTEPSTRDLVTAVLSGRKRPAVIDADGLNALAAGGPDALRRAGSADTPWVLTPHPGEAARLLECSAAAVQEDRLGAARRLAEAAGAVVVLKGHRTVIAAPRGRASINASGNPGMATAGSGDVLTGVIGALLARGLDPMKACRIAVFVHGDAGDRAAAAKGQEGMIAADLMERLPEAILALGGPEEGQPW